MSFEALDGFAQRARLPIDAGLAVCFCDTAQPPPARFQREHNRAATAVVPKLNEPWRTRVDDLAAVRLRSPAGRAGHWIGLRSPRPRRHTASVQAAVTDRDDSLIGLATLVTLFYEIHRAAFTRSRIIACGPARPADGSPFSPRKGLPGRHRIHRSRDINVIDGDGHEAALVVVRVEQDSC